MVSKEGTKIYPVFKLLVAWQIMQAHSSNMISLNLLSRQLKRFL